MEDMITMEMQICIENCVRAHESCVRTAAVHCLEVGGKCVDPQHFRLMLDCAQICQAAADFISRGSPRHPAICAICAEICQACAVECERMGGMEECVEVCRMCAASCLSLTGSVPSYRLSDAS